MQKQLRPADVAAQLGVSRSAVYNWIRSGAISARHVATSGQGATKRYRIQPAAIATLRTPAFTPPGAGPRGKAWDR